VSRIDNIRERRGSSADVDYLLYRVDAQQDALLRILIQTENAMRPSLMYLSDELEYQVLHILKDALLDEHERIDALIREWERRNP